MKTKCKVLSKYGYPISLSVLFVIAFLLRVYRIGELPDVLQLDEAGMGYNAWSLANYGVDRYLNEMPIYPQNHNGGQSPLYTYCLVVLCKVFDVQNLSTILVRIPALLSGMFVVLCGAKMLQLASIDRKFVVFGTAILSFSPIFIMQSRFALDCNMMLSTSILAVTLLLYYLKKKTWFSLLLCGGGFALVLYSYAISYIVLPIFLVMISLYMLYTRKFKACELFILAGEIIVCGLPIILFALCLLLKLPGFKFFGFNILPIAAERMEDVAVTGFWGNFLDCIKITLTHSFYRLDAVDKFYTMYLISIPFICIGVVKAVIVFVKSIKAREFAVDTIFLFYAVAVTVAIGFAGTGYVYRANAVFMSYLYFCVRGVQTIWEFLKSRRITFAIVVSTAYGIWTISFLKFYFTSYSIADFTYPNSLYFIPEKEALVSVVEEKECDKIYIDGFFEEYLYFYYPVDPHVKDISKRFCVDVNYHTPLERGSVYMVHKGNHEFLAKLQNSNVIYTVEEYEHYYVITV